MSENLSREPEEEPSPTLARDAVLLQMSRAPWIKSGGDVRSIAGWFCQFTVEEDEIKQVESLFADAITAAELPDTRVLLGHWVLQIDDVDHVTVWGPHATEEEADKTYATFNDVFGLFKIEGED